MDNITLGYIRVSTVAQNESRQWAAMDDFGVSRANVFVDKQSGKDFNRPAYIELMTKIKPGDTLVVQSIDRLGRNYEEIIEQWHIITREKLADIVVLDLPILDTRKDRDLTGTLITDMVLQLLSYVAQRERELNLERTNGGIAAAKAKGVRFGRKPKKCPVGFDNVYKAWQNDGMSARKAARMLGVSHNTFLKWTQEHRSK